MVDVLQSELISSHVGDPSSASGGLPPVEKLTLRGARKEAADEDIRRLAMSKLKDLILGDSAASRLGVSLQGMLKDGAHETLVLQSLMDCFRAKASRTLQKRANSLWQLSKELKKVGQLDSSEASDVEQALDLVEDTGDGCIETLPLPDFPGVPTDGLRVHCSSGLVHVVNEDDYLLCGRPMSRNFVLLSDVSVPSHVDSCQHCLRIFRRSREP